MQRICVIFDLDGTLVDSEALNNQAFLDLLPELDDSSEALVRRYRGERLSKILADLERRTGRRFPETFERDYRRRVSELFTFNLKPALGVHEMLDALKTLPKCVASSGPPSKIRDALKVSGLELHFGDNIFSSYEIGSWKPAPDLFLHAAATMGFKPDQCAVVEDSDVGIEAAVAAGMRAFQYLPTERSTPPEGVIPLYKMSDLPDLLERFDA